MRSRAQRFAVCFSLALSALLVTPSVVQAGEAEVKTLVSVDFFAVGGVGFGGSISEGEKAFKKIYAETDNLEQFVIVYGKGNNAARMYALMAFYRLDRALYDHLRAQYAESKITVPTMVGCSVALDEVGALITNLEHGLYDGIFPKEKKKELFTPAAPLDIAK